MSINSHQYKVINNNFKSKSSAIIEDLDTKELYFQKEIKYQKLTEEKIKEIIPIIKDNPTVLPVVDFQSSAVQNNHLILVTKYLKNGSLKEFLEKNKNCLTEDKKQIIIYGIAFAMMHFHIHDIYSGNLSIDHIYIDDNCYPYVDFSTFSSLKEQNIDDKEKYFLKSEDILSFLIIYYEVMTGVEIFINDQNKHIIPDLSLIQDDAHKLFLQKNWSNGIRQIISFREIFNEINILYSVEFLRYNLIVDDYKSLYIHNFKKESNLLDNIDDIYTYGKLLLAKYKKCENLLDEVKPFFKKAANSGNIDAMFDYSDVFYSDKNDNSESLHYMKKAADLGKIQAMLFYGLLSKNQQDKVHYIKKSADLGSCNSMRVYGIYLINGKIIQQDINEAVKYIKMSAENGSDVGMIDYADLLFVCDENPQNKKEAAEYYKIAADLGNEKGIKNYAQMLYIGDGIDENKVLALQYFKILADKGDIHDISDYINKLLLMNKTEEEKYKEAADYIKKEIEKGNYEHKEHFLNLVRKNIGIPIEKKEAAQYYKLAADIGETDNIYMYALLCDNGDIIPENKEDAAKYYKKAADNGNVDALNKFVNMLKNDEIDFDKKESYKQVYYKKAAENGNVIAMNEYGIILKNAEKDYEGAAKLFQSAADKGNIEAMFNYGVMLKNGEGVAQNEEESDKCFKIVVDSDDFISLICYAKMINSEEKSPEKIVKEFQYLKNRSELGFENADLALKSLKNIETGSQDFLIGRTEFFKKEAENDDFEAIYKYATMLENGIGVQENYEEAINYYKYLIDKKYYRPIVDFIHLLTRKGKEIFSLDVFLMNVDYIQKVLKTITDADLERENLNANYYKMAANIGVVDAMRIYGYMLSDGDGVPANKKLAIKYYKMAIKKNDPLAMFFYALMLQRGDGTEINYKEAAKLYKKAADMGINDAMNNYGVLLQSGLGVPIDKKEAAKFFKMAAENDSTKGMFNYGRMLIYGNGIPENKSEGAYYLKSAADKNDGNAALLYAQLLEKGDGIPINLEEAKKYYQIASEENKAAKLELRRFCYSFSNAI